MCRGISNNERTKGAPYLEWEHRGLCVTCSCDAFILCTDCFRFVDRNLYIYHLLKLQEGALPNAVVGKRAAIVETRVVKH